MAINIPGFPRKNIIKRNEDNIVLVAALVTIGVHVVRPVARWVKGKFQDMRTEADVDAGARPMRSAA